MAVCLATALATVAVSVSSFTLAWTHSIEKLRWEERWRVDGDFLLLEQVRMRGHGAGMEPAAGAELIDGVWQWQPLTRHAMLRLARSEFVADYEWCAEGNACRPLAAILPTDGALTEIRACAVSTRVQP